MKNLFPLTAAVAAITASLYFNTAAAQTAAPVSSLALIHCTPDVPVAEPVFNSTVSFPLWLQKNLSVPESWNGHTETVIVTFTISAKGEVQVMKTSGGVSLLRRHAAKIITETSGMWKPALRQQTPIAFVLEQPVTFSRQMYFGND
jgi:hypothetical protein